NTLMVMEYLMGSIRGARRLTTRRRPLVVMVEGRPLLGALRRRHLTPQELLSRLRVNGVKDPCELELVILEIRGSLTIVRRGATIGRAVVADGEGRELIPRRLLTTGAAGDPTNWPVLAEGRPGRARCDRGLRRARAAAGPARGRSGCPGAVRGRRRRLCPCRRSAPHSPSSALDVVWIGTS